MSFAAVLERLQQLANPYPGLRPFETDESHLFFGRDTQVAELVSRLERHRFLAVLGVSGSGKSSLVRAGLIPVLERGRVSEAGRRWRIVVTRPAGRPFESLGADLGRAGLDASNMRESSHGLIEIARQLPPDESLLVVVDQFEELFRYKDLSPAIEGARRRHDQRAAEATEFVQMLLAGSRHHPPVYVVLTMRSDYLGDCAGLRDLPEALNDCQYLVPRMTRPQRKEAIEGPLGQVQIAPRLVQRMLNDVGDEPDQLPILQHALMRTWDHWRRTDPSQTRRIDLEDYEAIGGFEGALNQHADELLANVPHEIAMRVFKRLTARGRSDRERRDPARLGELWDVCGAETPERQAQVTAAIDQFRRGDATFLSPRADALEPDTYIDITHESLIRLWKKLRDEWLPDEQQSVQTLLELASRAANWKTGNGELLGGRDLARAAEWDRRRNHAVAWAQHYVDTATLADVVDFVEASRAHERKRVLRTRVQWGVAGLLVVALAVWAVGETLRRSETARAAAENAKEVAQARAAAAVAEEYAAELSRAATDVERLKSQTELVTRRRDSVVPPSAPSPSTSLAPRIYIQVRTKSEAERVKGDLTRRFKDRGWIVPEPEVLETGPTVNEVRYFRTEDRQTAEQIVDVVQKDFGKTRAQYVSGYESSSRIRAQHYELWLVPGDVLRTLVAQLNDQSPEVRKSAGGLLARDHRANPTAIGLVLGTLSEENLPSLIAEGRINALYFLNRSELGAWTDVHRKVARDAIARVRARAASGVAVGQQTDQELTALEKKLAS